MNKYRVIITETANDNLYKIYWYILDELENPISAQKIFDALLRKCKGLFLFPEISPVRYIINKEKWRTVHYGKYTIFYSVDKKSRIVKVRRIVYSRQV